MLLYTMACLIGVTAADAQTPQTYVLYDGSIGAGTQTPDDQGFVYAYFPFPPFGVNLAAQSASDGITTLDTDARLDDHAGYFTYFPWLPFIPFGGRHPNMPRILDRVTGFTVDFSVRILSESHPSPRDDNRDGLDDRAGFSIIVIARDRHGIELAFWEDAVWAYDDDGGNAADLFTHAEGTAGFEPSAEIRNYSLVIKGDEYNLLADNQLILSGPLRDYTHETVPVFNPYTTPNLIVLRDDTASAGASVEIGYVAVTAPEPSTLALLLMAFPFIRRPRRR